MKIGIFGDSFGCEHVLFREYKDYANHRDFGRSWVTHFRNINPSDEIDNYCLSGSCMYYSYKKYQENKHKYDQNIFICTDHLRVTKILDDKANEPGWTVPSANSAKHKSMSCKPSEEKTFYESAMAFILFVQDPVREETFWNFMYNDIQLDENIFIINSFNKPNNTSDCLYNISSMEERSLMMNINKWDKFKNDTVDMRYNHITSQNNYLLAKDIQKQIGSKEKIFKLDVSKYKFDHEDVQKYFVPKNMLKKGLP